MRDTAISPSGKNCTYKMLRKKVCKDRQVLDFPSCYSELATPYKVNDFHPDIKQACLENKTLALGFKLSKAIFIGDMSVGKTSLVNRFCNEVFDNNYKATIGVDFEVEKFEILQTAFNLQMWDTSGQERFRCIASSYYRGSHVIVVVFDVSNHMSLTNCAKWLNNALECNKAVRPICFLVGTKKDLLSDAALHGVERLAREVANSLDAELWMVSSKTGEGVNEFFFRLAALAFDAGMRREWEARHVHPDASAEAIISGKELGDTSLLSNRTAKKIQCNSCNK